MKKTDIVIIILLVIAAGLSAVMYLRPSAEGVGRKITDFPIEISGWKGRDILLDDKVYKILETRNVLMREYENPESQSVYLYIVSSDVNRRVAHPPEVCYAGDGVEIMEKGLENFSGIRVNKFISRKNGNTSLIYYWFKAGDKFTDSYLVQQAKSIFNQITGRTGANALMRVSTDIINEDKEKASRILKEFIRILIPHLDI